MDARLQRRIQRYGWDLAAADYEQLWKHQLSVAQVELIRRAAPSKGERVLDVACGTGLITFATAAAVGDMGRIDGIDISDEMIKSARGEALRQGASNLTFSRMDAECLTYDAASFDLVMCSLGLMYMPDPELAIREMRRVLRSNGRVVLAVWGERKHCGWSPLFEIVQEEVSSEVCPLFFRLGQRNALTELCQQSGYGNIVQHVIETSLHYADADEACRAAFSGGPVALAWSRFDTVTRARVYTRYLDSIAPWKVNNGYKVPAEFLIVSAVAKSDEQHLL